MESSIAQEKLELLFDSLIGVLLETGKVKNCDLEKIIIFKLLGMKDNNRSQIFASSSLWLDESVAETLLEKGLVQVVNEEQEKYALTFKGIAKSIESKYNINLELQFLSFLENTDKVYSAVDHSKLSWKEKLASLAFLLMGSTSKESAVSLITDHNMKILTEVFERTLQILKDYNIIESSAMLSTGRRKETPVAYLISRLQDLPKRTNHIYQVPGNSEYFLDLEVNSKIDKRKTLFLLKRIFDTYDPTCDYKSLEEELKKVSLKYSPSFLERKILQKNIFDILIYLSECFDKIYRLPQKNG